MLLPIKYSFIRILLLTSAAIVTAGASEIPIAGIDAFHQGDSLDGDGSILDAINGTGMDKIDADDPKTWTVGNTAWADDWQGFDVPAVGGNNTWVVLDLGEPAQNLKTMYLWNVQETNALDRGTNEFEVFHATDPTVAPPGTSDVSTPYDFASGGWTSMGGSELAMGVQIGDPGRAYDVSEAAGARYIGLKLLSNHGGIRVGLAEIAFTDVEDENALTLGEPVVPPDPGESDLVPITAVFGFHQGDSFDANGSILRIADNSIFKGPTPEDPTTWTHSNAWPDDWQGFDVPGSIPNGTWVVLDFGETWNLATLLLWNVNEGNATDRGMNEFKLYTATNPTVVPPEVSDTPTAYDFASGGWTGFGDTMTLAQASGLQGEAINGTYDLTGIAPARYLGIEILSHHGGTRVGFGHVAIVPNGSPGQGLQIVNVDTSELEADRVGITWRSRPGQVYGISYSNDLQNWIEVTDGISGEIDSETTTYIDTDSAISDASKRYYHVFEVE